MKIIVSTALIAAQTAIVAQPAFAAEIQREATVATGTFAGLRLRVPMGGSRAERTPRVGLALAPTVHGLSEDGAARLRIGEGLEFGFSGRGQTPAFSWPDGASAPRRTREMARNTIAAGSTPGKRC